MPTILRIYGSALAKLPGDIGKSPWVLILPVLYSIASDLVARLVAPMGIIGGFIMGFVQAVLGASFLFFVDEVVSRSPVRIHELPNSFRRYLWPVMNVLFVFWIASIVAGMVLQNLPPWAQLGIAAVLLILLNATPEVIYLRRLWNGMDVIMGSVNFIQENWIEWFIPNLPIAAALFGMYLGFLPVRALFERALGLWPGSVAYDLVVGAFVFIFFVFRGNLFRELDSGGARARRFRYGR